MKTKIALETKPLLHCCGLGWTMLREGRSTATHNYEKNVELKHLSSAPVSEYSAVPAKPVLANSAASGLCTFLRPDNTLTFLQEGCDYGNCGGGMTRAQAPQSRFSSGPGKT